MTLRAAALVAALALLLPASAHAGTVTAGAGLTFTAAGGEANQLAVSRTGDRIVFSDVVPIGEGAAECTGDGTFSVSCAALASVDVALGDGDDTLTLGAIGGGLPATADGGEGDDTLDASASTGFADVRGGAGADTLRAGSGESDLTGGDGADTLVGGPDGALTAYLMGAAADGADIVYGGAGFDVAGYAQRSTPLALSGQRCRRRRRGRRGRQPRGRGGAARGRQRRRPDRRVHGGRGRAERWCGQRRADGRPARRSARGRRR